MDGPRVQEAVLRAEMVSKPEARRLVLLKPADEATWYLGMLSIRPTCRIEAQAGFSSVQRRPWRRRIAYAVSG
jgi:hypothetical protein